MSYALISDTGRFPLECSYLPTGEQFGVVGAEIVSAPYSKQQYALSDGYAKPTAYKLEGVQVGANLPADMAALAAFAQTATGLERPNDSTLPLIPGPWAEVDWAYDQSLNIDKVTLIVVSSERLGSGIGGGVTPPTLPIVLTPIKGDKGDKGDAGDPGLGLPTTSFPGDEGKIPVARGNAAGGFALEHIFNRFTFGAGITGSLLSNGKMQLASSSSSSGPTYRGTWSSTFTGGYGLDDIVWSDGGIWHSKAASNTADLSDTTKWESASGATITPSVTLASSSTNVTAAGDITLTATTAHIAGVDHVEFYQGSTLVGTDTTAPYTATVPLSGPDNGTLAFTAQAFDSSLVMTLSNTVSVVVNIAGWFTGTFPAAAAYNSLTYIPVSFTPSGAYSGVASTELYINGVASGFTGGPSGSIIWHPPTGASGAFEFQIVGLDSSNAPLIYSNKMHVSNIVVSGFTDLNIYPYGSVSTSVAGTINFEAVPSGPAVDHVDFTMNPYSGSASISPATATAFPFIFSPYLDSSLNGTWSLQAISYNAAGSVIAAATKDVFITI